ncbi:MAG: hypothetical protein ACK4S2_08330 [Gemmobacter sp.]
MQTLSSGYRSLSLLLNLNWDRLFSLATIVLGLLAGAFLGSVISQL